MTEAEIKYCLRNMCICTAGKIISVGVTIGGGFVDDRVLSYGGLAGFGIMTGLHIYYRIGTHLALERQDRNNPNKLEDNLR